MQSQLAGLRGECALKLCGLCSPPGTAVGECGQLHLGAQGTRECLLCSEGRAEVELLACAASYACSVVQGKGLPLHGSSVSCSAKLLCVLLSLGVSCGRTISCMSPDP